MTTNSATKNRSAASWLDDRLAFIRGLKSPTDHQRSILDLHAKNNRTSHEQKLLDALVKVERFAVKHEDAMASLASAQNHQTAADRALETRKKTIVGGWIIANDPATFKRVVSKLTRKQDRDIFGLTSSAEPAPAMPTTSAEPTPAITTDNSPNPDLDSGTGGFGGQFEAPQQNASNY